MNMTPVDEEAKTRVTIEIALDGVGNGEMFAPLARRGASNEVGLDGEHLKNQAPSYTTPVDSTEAGLT